MTAQNHIGQTNTSLTSFFATAQAGFMSFGKSAVGAFAKAADAAGKYQLTMKLVQQQLMASGPTMEKIGGTIMSLSTGKQRTIFDVGQLAGMVQEYQQHGLSASQINRLMPDAAYAAEMEYYRTHGATTPKAFAAGTGSMIKGYGLADPGREKELASFMDTYTRIASVSPMNAAGLRSLEARVGSTARVFNVSAKDFITGSGWLTQRGIQPNEVGTIWRNILTNAIPHAGLTSHAANAQYGSLMLLGLLKAPRKEDAKLFYHDYMNAQRKLGFTALDPSKMSSKAQEQFALGLMRSVTGSSALTGNIRDLFVKLHSSFERFRELYGVKDKSGRIVDDKQARKAP